MYCRFLLIFQLLGIVFSATAQQVPTPTLSEDSGSSYVEFDVAVDCPDTGVQLYYTKDGSEPTVANASVVPGSKIHIDRPLTLKVKGFKTNASPSVLPSATVTGNYRVTGQVVVGASGGAILRSDGTVWTWGRNIYGELGNGATATYSYQVSLAQVPSLNGIVAITGTGQYYLALKSDGTLWGWGSNSVAFLGTGGYSSSSIPIPTLMPTQANGSGAVSFVAVSGGETHVLALTNEGDVYAWGQNDHGQLGSAAGSIKEAPIRVSNLSGVKSVVVGSNHSLALLMNGSVKGWGYDAKCQLGFDTYSSSAVALTQVPMAPTLGAIYAGGDNSGGISPDGFIYTWGSNSNGQLGVPTPSVRPNPAKVGSNLNRPVDSISNGSAGRAVIALANDGTLWTWG